nr:type II toxin-antitoxin system RelE/ParE family toxin [Sphingomonas formosensis]
MPTAIPIGPTPWSPSSRIVPTHWQSAPYTARIGDIPGTREYLLRDLQYLLIYTIDDDGIFVVRVLSTRERA